MTRDQIDELLWKILPSDGDHAVHALIHLVETIANDHDHAARKTLASDIAQLAFAHTVAFSNAMEDFISAPEPDAEREG
jgi:hypothetical protein